MLAYCCFCCFQGTDAEITSLPMTCESYYAIDTDYATQGYSTCSFVACGGTSVYVDGCDCDGDSYLRLFDETSQVSSNDDSCGSGLCSYMSYTVQGNSSSCQTFTIAEGCYSVNSCSGTVVVSNCPLGSIIASSVCVPCPGGYTSLLNSCDICPAGTYSHQGICESCVPGEWSSEGASACTKCQSGLTTSRYGSTNESECTSPLGNIIMSFIFLFLSAIGLMLYIIGGRLQRMAFVRKERLVNKSRAMFNMTYELLLNATSLCSEIAFLRHKRRKLRAIGTKLWKSVVLVFFSFIVVVILFLSSILRVFFTSLILWRGYDFLGGVSYLNRITLYTDYLLVSIHLTKLQIVLYPFLYALNAIASLKLDFSSTVRVSCLGSQSVLQLFVDCIVVGVAVIIIQSDMEVYWGTIFSSVQNKFRSLLFQRNYWKSIGWNIGFLLWSVVFDLVPHPRKILQYCLSFVRIRLFFERYFHADSSSNCDVAVPFRAYPLIGADTVLAYCSSAFAYLSIFPVVYLLSQIVVPRFKLNPGTVKAKGKIMKLAKIHAEKRFRCPKCDLGLHRQYTSYFGKVISFILS